MITQRRYLERNVEWRTNKPALEIVDSDETVTYAEFDERVNRIANALTDRGVRKGDRVAMVLFNTVEFPVTLYACYKLGAVPVPINFMLAQDNFRYIFDDIAPKVLVYDAAVEDDITAALESATVTAHTVGVDDCANADESFESLADDDASPPPEVPIEPGDPTYILYTSGTTGMPKGVTFTAETASNRAQEGARNIGHSQATVALQLSPWFHAGGVDLTVHPVIEAGGTILVTQDWEPESVVEMVETEDVTHIVGVPTVAQRMTELEGIDERDLSSLDCLLCMGSPLSKQLAEEIMETITPNLYNGYGTTETLLDTMLRPEDLPEHAGSAGRPTNDTEVNIIEFDRSRVVAPDETVPHGEEGEIVVSSDAALDYYFGSKEKTKESIRSDWYYTDDLGVIDDGYLTITGRADDMILSGGELVSPIEVEEALEANDDVEAATVVGTEDEEWGQIVTAYVVADDLDADDLDEYCKDNESLADYKRPRKYEFVDEIERTATGKKQRYKYRDD
ncbi:class I adenylate-forming enzyme family protein [Natrinema sp. DC36]|uniref:class I adenylate-forming enzyme family protein n=1 Tax=Natrinema sp. DC36 TaxID=2878680 RepID=UPI001CF06C31|nr:class I adenylate-forming enzyme family protein [Natrinema sp. DC36]